MREGLAHVMSDHDDGHLGFVPEPLHQRVNLRSDTRVKCSEWFIEKKDFRLHNQGLRQRETLLYASGELHRILVLGKTHVLFLFKVRKFTGPDRQCRGSQLVNVERAP